METLIATATFGLEFVVSRELRALGYESRAMRPGWLSFRGDASAIARANLWLRASDRVLVEMSAFEAPDFGVLFDATRATPWERFLPANGSFPVRGRSVKSKLSSIPACQRIVKKAIVERLRHAHRVETLPEDGPVFPVEIAILKDQVTLALDTSGAGLHKRGYRPISGEAPLKETLAAGLILLSVWNRERPFLDPFCGTGTLPIEAALIARNRAPGMLREFLSEGWPTVPAQIWNEARDEARDAETEPSSIRIEGSDIDAAPLALAREHAARAGVAEDILFAQKPFADIRSERTHGCLVCNPPYGDRLGDAASVRELYRSFPNVLRRFPTWSHYILTASRELEALVGQKADRRRKLYNGRIECTYYQFLGPRPGGTSDRAAFGGIDAKGERQHELFANRIKKRAHHLRKWPAKRGIDAFRLYDRDIKEVPLSVDRYGELALITPARDRVTSRTKAQREDWLDEMARAVADTLGLSLDDVIISGRPNQERTTKLRESGLIFEVRLDGIHDTGLPLEGRRLRQRVRETALNQSFLSVPSRAGTYGVAATAGGARSVTNVEPSPRYQDWARRNFVLNGLDPAVCRFRSDLDGGRYDLIVVDEPPPDDTVERAASMLTEGGVLFALVHGRERVVGGEDVTDDFLPEDFRSRRRVRFWKISRAS